ncbi:uncharacterized protein LOC135377455 [Ornithodoros turicata]|uniref:uncharacterized protein LOC135377455 n=1 Tax=Ornithodoros turicata TaxID=34597 RepID=UPI0031394786
MGNSRIRFTMVCAEGRKQRHHPNHDGYHSNLLLPFLAWSVHDAISSHYRTATGTQRCKSDEHGVGIINNLPLVQSMLITTAVLCYVFWLCTYLMQMHPFFGPLLENSTLIAANEYWPSK